MSAASSTPAWETIKENAAPLQRGRNVSTLEQTVHRSIGGGGALQPRRDDSKEQIAAHERLVRPSEAPHVTQAAEDDPLEHWLAYIRYHQNAFPSDTHEQFLLMERCTRAIVKMPQYANDDRFIRVCAKYADKTKEPAQVFKYLHQQRVGGLTALFWVAWAYVAEKDNDFPFAEQIYKKGISKNAQPMNTLKVRHKQFQRRMSRHWLDNSQVNDQIDEYDDGEEAASASRSSRGALGGLTHDRVRRNDRVRMGIGARSRVGGRRRPGAPSAADPRPIRNTTNTNHLPAANNTGAFAIFVENEGENAPNGILEEPTIERKRVIEKDADRRKENTLDAERWNERGSLARQGRSAQSQSTTSSRGAPPPFAVFVDEECVAQHGREKEEQQAQTERHRSARDDRTFRERGDEGMAERLARDPLRYLKDPKQLDSDRAAAQEQEEQNAKHQEVLPPKTENRSRIGFNKRLLKNSKGEEQTFEEVRAKTKCYTLAVLDVNFNLLQVTRADQSSQMDLDDGASMDVSMTESSPGQNSVASQPRKLAKLSCNAEGRVLFRSEVSFEHSANDTAISTASSTVNEAEAVGIPTRKEEETINTKFAMRELSMMFSSPAFGVDDDGRRTERQTGLVNQSINEEGATVNTSFANVGDVLGTSILDNSILNYDGPTTLNENGGPRNPLARNTATPGFDKMALRELKASSEDDGSLSCTAQRSRPALGEMQDDPFQSSEVELTDDPGFQIYEDETTNAPPTAERAWPTASARIYEEIREETAVKPPSAQAPSDVQGFSIFQDSEQPERPSGSPVFEEEGKNWPEESADAEGNGDTATLSLFGEVVGLLHDDGNHVGDVSGSDTDAEDGNETNDGGNTASISLFNEVFADLSQTNDRSRVDQQPPLASGGFSIFIEEEKDDPKAPVQEHRLSSQRKLKMARESNESRSESDIEYGPTHERGTKMALRRLQASSSVASNSRAPLLSLLSTSGKSYHLPHIVLPREFRSNHLSSNTQVQIGKHLGMMSKELGRGAYGVVALMDVEKSRHQISTIAVKAQSPTGCLAMEYEILGLLEDRIRKPNQTRAYAFPRPLTFISLADGGILSMTAASKSGLNLVDLANIYKLKLGEQVPEIVTLHYTSRMLRHVEHLHWHGRVLHCDVKPDNFVLCTLGCDDNKFQDIEHAELMLVDFGRAINMEEYATNGVNCRTVLFRGDACQDDMKCVAMREGKAWSYDIDTFGILSCAHVLLYGSHLRIRKGRDQRWRMDNTLKRYWQKELWGEIFDTLLNLDEESGAAIGSRSRSLKDLRDKIDRHLETESSKLKSFLARQVSLLPSSREQIR